MEPRREVAGWEEASGPHNRGTCPAGGLPGALHRYVPPRIRRHHGLYPPPRLQLQTPTQEVGLHAMTNCENNILQAETFVMKKCTEVFIVCVVFVCMGMMKSLQTGRRFTC